ADVHAFTAIKADVLPGINCFFSNIRILRTRSKPTKSQMPSSITSSIQLLRHTISLPKGVSPLNVFIGYTEHVSYSSLKAFCRLWYNATLIKLVYFLLSWLCNIFRCWQVLV